MGDKQIKEMAKIEIGAILEKVNMGDGYANINSLADQIYHIVIPEGSVVLTEEEYETLQKQLDYWKNETVVAREEGYQWFCKARKQAVKEFAERLKEKLEENSPIAGYDLEDLEFDGETIQECIDEIAKEFGVEVE